MLKWIFHKRELLLTFDAAEYQRVCLCLSDAKIPYRTKWVDLTPGHGRTGGFGVKKQLQYYVYVLDCDLDEAAFRIRKQQ